VVLPAREDGWGERDGVRCQFVAPSRFAGRYRPGRLVDAVNRLQPDVIHLNGLGFPFHARALSALGPPVLVQDHADSANGRTAVLRRWGFAHIAGAAFAAPEQAAPFFTNRLLKPRTRVFMVPESSTHFRAGEQATARAATSVFGAPVFLWVGHLNDNKDPLTILDAFSRALPQLPDAQLWLCYATAPLLDHVQARLAAQPALAAHVHLVGRIPHDKIEPFFQAADFFVLGSRREGCNYALIEALACGATPIVSDIPSNRALTGQGRVGALVTPGDAAGFAAAFVALAARPAAERQAKALAHFNAELSFAVLGRKLAAAYQDLIGGSDRS
jgi:glycosyltransferase involved in cell wall biosynthesis